MTETETLSHREQAYHAYTHDADSGPQYRGRMEVAWNAGYDAALTLADELAEALEAQLKGQPHIPGDRARAALVHYRAARGSLNRTEEKHVLDHLQHEWNVVAQ